MGKLRLTEAEIIILIVIVFVLAAILTPVFMRAREMQVRASCVKNQNDAVQVMTWYMTDNNGCWPDDPGAKSWSVQVEPYNYHYPACYDCPKHPGKGTAQHPDFGFNSALFALFEGKITDPAHTIVTADVEPAALTGSYTINPKNPRFAARHGGHIVFTTADFAAHALPVPKGTTAADALRKAGFYLELRKPTAKP